MAKISIIGAGNLSWNLAIALETAGHSVQEIYSRSLTNAEKITKLLYNCKATNSLNFENSTSELFIIAVSDDAIKLVSEQLILPEFAVLTHTSGAKNLNDLNPKDPNIEKGIFYPLMTFTYGIKVDFKEIPICIEAENKEVENWLKTIAKTLSHKVLVINERERLALHVSAVFSCNFANHFWALSKEILDSENLDFNLLKPLVKETMKKAFQADHPADVQTGPAIRDDQKTIAKHIEFLKDELELDELYKQISSNINQWHND